MKIRRSPALAASLLAAACSTNSPSVAPSALAPPALLRLNATAGPSEGEHDHTAATVISIVGSVGTTAYLPNPLQTAMGSMLVWMNSDLVPHNIVLSDGTPVGMVNPGEMTPAVMMNTPAIGYYCTIHPSMTGVIADPAIVIPDPAPMPPPADYYPYPEPDDGYYDY
jgi:plastocyanin